LAILAKYEAGVAKKQQQILWGPSKKVFKVEQVARFIFYIFLTCFLTF
jgi:hypothetical protein